LHSTGSQSDSKTVAHGPPFLGARSKGAASGDRRRLPRFPSQYSNFFAMRLHASLCTNSGESSVSKSHDKSRAMLYDFAQQSGEWPWEAEDMKKKIEIQLLSLLPNRVP
jgi:hypothetical protein